MRQVVGLTGQLDSLRIESSAALAAKTSETAGSHEELSSLQEAVKAAEKKQDELTKKLSAAVRKGKGIAAEKQAVEEKLHAAQVMPGLELLRVLWRLNKR